MDNNRALYQEIGRRVRDARESRGLSQESLAEAIELSRTSVTNIEGGNQQMPVHVLLRLAAALDVQVNELVPNASGLDGSAAAIPADMSPRTAALMARLAQKVG